MPQDDPRTAGGTSRRLASGLREAWRSTVTRPMARRGPVPDSFVQQPTGLGIGSSERAAEMLRGQFTMAGASARAERGDPWRVDPPSTGWAEAMHGFGWLRDFRAVDGETARKAARKLTDAWLHRYAKSGALAWQPGITGDRVTAWCLAGQMLTENAEPVYRSDFFRSLAGQARYLMATAGDEERPLDRLRAGMGATYAALSVQGGAADLPKSYDIVLAALKAGLRADGGPASRNPSDLFRMLRMAVQLRGDMERSGEGALAAKLTTQIERMTPVLRLLRAGDGTLSLFNGGKAESAEEIDRVLVDSRDSSPAAEAALESGFLRLSEDTTHVVMDAGDVPGGPFARTGHAAPLSLELSSGRKRIIVNCGSAQHLGAEWETPCRASAAHSTLTIAERSPCEFEGKGGTRFRRIVSGAKVIDRRRDTDSSGIWALAAHDGYAARYGLVHYRRLFLSAEGVDFRGEDTLTLTKSGARILEKARAARKSPDGPNFAIRFHLHPEVAARVVEGRVEIILNNGEEWQMLQSGGVLSLEDSIYIPGLASPAPGKQIVIEAALRDTEGQVRWAFKRLNR